MYAFTAFEADRPRNAQASRNISETCTGISSTAPIDQLSEALKIVTSPAATKSIIILWLVSTKAYFRLSFSPPNMVEMRLKYRSYKMNGKGSCLLFIPSVHSLVWIVKMQDSGSNFSRPFILLQFTTYLLPSKVILQEQRQP
jgi:hypothetical protein